MLPPQANAVGAAAATSEDDGLGIGILQPPSARGLVGPLEREIGRVFEQIRLQRDGRDHGVLLERGLDRRRIAGEPFDGDVGVHVIRRRAAGRVGLRGLSVVRDADVEAGAPGAFEERGRGPR